MGEHDACLHELLAVQASPALQELLLASPRLHVVIEDSRLERVAFTTGVSHSPMQLPYTTHLQHSGLAELKSAQCIKQCQPISDQNNILGQQVPSVSLCVLYNKQCNPSIHP
jgi:hypothetical protein